MFFSPLHTLYFFHTIISTKWRRAIDVCQNREKKESDESKERKKWMNPYNNIHRVFCIGLIKIHTRHDGREGGVNERRMKYFETHQADPHFQPHRRKMNESWSKFTKREERKTINREKHHTNSIVVFNNSLSLMPCTFTLLTGIDFQWMDSSMEKADRGSVKGKYWFMMSVVSFMLYGAHVRQKLELQSFCKLYIEREHE